MTAESEGGRRPCSVFTLQLVERDTSTNSDLETASVLGERKKKSRTRRAGMCSSSACSHSWNDVVDSCRWSQLSVPRMRPKRAMYAQAGTTSLNTSVTPACCAASMTSSFMPALLLSYSGNNFAPGDAFDQT